MTKKQQVDLDTYQKRPRALAEIMMEALEPGAIFILSWSPLLRIVGCASKSGNVASTFTTAAAV